MDTPTNPATPEAARSTESQWKRTRRVGGGVQSRVWLPKPIKYSLNLGVCAMAENGRAVGTAECAAERVSQEFSKAWQGDRTVSDVVAELQRRGLVRANIKVPAKVAGATQRMLPPPKIGKPYRPRRPAENRYLYTRHVKGRAVQSRVWLPQPVSFGLNLGVCTLAENDQDVGTAEWRAGKISSKFVQAWQGDLTIAEVVAELQRQGIVKPGVRVPDRVARLTQRMLPVPPPNLVKPIVRVPRGFVKWKIEGVGEARLLALASSEPPPGSKHWTPQLLAEALIKNGSFDSIGICSVINALKRLAPPKIEDISAPSGKARHFFVAKACEQLRQERLATLAAASHDLAA